MDVVPDAVLGSAPPVEGDVTEPEAVLDPGSVAVGSLVPEQPASAQQSADAVTAAPKTLAALLDFIFRAPIA